MFLIHTTRKTAGHYDTNDDVNKWGALRSIMSEKRRFVRNHIRLDFSYLFSFLQTKILYSFFFRSHFLKFCFRYLAFRVCFAHQPVVIVIVFALGYSKMETKFPLHQIPKWNIFLLSVREKRDEGNRQLVLFVIALSFSK